MSRTHRIQTRPFWRLQISLQRGDPCKNFRYKLNTSCQPSLHTQSPSLFLRDFNQALISIDFYPVSGRNRFRRVLIKLGHSRYTRNHCTQASLGVAFFGDIGLRRLADKPQGLMGNRPRRPPLGRSEYQYLSRYGLAIPFMTEINHFSRIKIETAKTSQSPLRNERFAIRLPPIA